MMKYLLLITGCIALLCCNNNAAEKDEQKTATATDSSVNNTINIPFTEAKNYFVKNTFKEDSLINPKIVSAATFDSIFGMAATMGEKGKPTPIDFSKQYVIAVIQPETNKATSLAVKSLLQKDDAIILTYTKTEGEKQSFTTTPFLLLIVDKQYDGKIEIRSS